MTGKVVSFEQAARLIPDGAAVTASSSSGLDTPDRMLAAVRRRFETEGGLRGIAMLPPVAAGDMWGIEGIDHVARRASVAVG